LVEKGGKRPCFGHKKSWDSLSLLASLCFVSVCLSFPLCEHTTTPVSITQSPRAAMGRIDLSPPQPMWSAGGQAGTALRGATSPSPTSQKRSSIFFFTPRPHRSLTVNRCYCKHRNKGACTGEGDRTRKRERWKADKQPKLKQCWEKLNCFSIYSYLVRSWSPIRSQGHQGSGAHCGLGARGELRGLGPQGMVGWCHPLICPVASAVHVGSL